jgi:hypothetical protein
MASQISIFAFEQLETATEERFLPPRMPRCYKQDSWGNELIVKQSPASKNMNTEAENIIRIRQEAMIGEDIAN